ncbi:hypothetical protein EPA93_00815 [Ktedonosporobacter rubrisoli]|uniref:Uncharacterized protein n=1 Tax=Ktedonosporobacter rubrisoli TaxID=2509675 RepID=A0A4P6JHU5_KTERU|nr:hypothetical protein [Ktedonosporobacter rubrisoli]QBD74609.1 hypothetical protein EPA93_00815 [Ktedonosporobacter rubrisoli]
MKDGQKNYEKTREQDAQTPANRSFELRRAAEQASNDAVQQPLPSTSDTGGGISDGSVYDASSEATGGGVDTPLAVERSTENTIGKQKPLNQGSSATSGGGADNGSNL